MSNVCCIMWGEGNKKSIESCIMCGVGKYTSIESCFMSGVSNNTLNEGRYWPYVYFKILAKTGLLDCPISEFRLTNTD